MLAYRAALESVFVSGDFAVSFAATVAGRYTRWGGPQRLSVRGEPLIVPTRGP